MKKLSNSIIFRAVLNVLIIVLLLLALLMNISAFTKYQALAVVSGSMEPTLPYGSLILISPQEAYEADDIVTFRSSGDGETKRFTHRIVSVEGDMADTKGDANNTADPEPTSLQRAEGKVMLTVPLAGYPVIWFEQGWVKIAAVALVILWMALEIEFARRRKRNVPEEADGRTTE